MLNLPLPVKVQDTLVDIVDEVLKKCKSNTGWDLTNMVDDVRVDIDAGPGDFYILGVSGLTENRIGEKLRLFSRVQLTNMSMIIARDDGQRLDIIMNATEDTAQGFVEEVLKAKGFDYSEEYKRHMNNKNNYLRSNPQIPIVVNPNMPKDEIYLRSGDNITKIKLGPKKNKLERDPKWK